jgi:hypothetical protein
MKYVRRLIFLGLVVGYFLWPYHSVKKFAAAVEARDSETIASMIDAEAFVDSMKDLAVEAAVVAAESRANGARFDKDAMRAQLRSMMDSGPFAQMMGEQMKPETLTRMMFASANSAANQGNNSAARTERWVNPVTFSVQEPGSEARAIFKFRGLGWKLAGVEVPAKEIRRFLPVGAM